MSDSKKKESPVIHVKVTVTTAVNPQTGEQEYIPKYQPEVIRVTDSDTVLNFKLDQPTPDDVIVTSVTARPSDNTQLSTPSISTNGKQVTLTDINTVRQTLNLDFVFGTKHSNQRTLLAKSQVTCASSQYPEIDNDPPP